ncbi:unnamed protein product [Symbiodinium sp. KB8]|nr:unnamed protein product [Symbiodinium sp. KB8]
MSDEQREAIRDKAGLILYHALGHLQAHEDPDPQQMSRDARQVRTLARDVLQIVTDCGEEAEVGETAASCFDRICYAANRMQHLGTEDFRAHCLHWASLCLQATRRMEEMLVAGGVPTAIVSEELGADSPARSTPPPAPFYIPESGTEAESGAITAPTDTADPRDAFVDSAADPEPHELVVEDLPVLLPGMREGQLVAHRQGLESQLQQMRAEGAGLIPLAETLHKLGSALLEEGEAQHARQAMDYLHESLQIQRCLHEGAAHLSIAHTLYDLGRASSILENREHATLCFLESLEMRQRPHLDGDGENLATLYRLSNELVLSVEFRQAQAQVFVQQALRLAESLWPGYLESGYTHRAVSASCGDAQELIEAGDGWADNLREVLRRRDLEFCRVLTARDKPLTVLPSADSADLIDAPLPEDFPLQVWLKAPGKEDRRTLTSLLHLYAKIHERHNDRPLAAVKCWKESLRVVGCLAEDQDTKSTADALHELGKMHLVTKDFREAVRCLKKALRMKRSLYDDQDTASVAKTLDLLGQATVRKQAHAMHELGKKRLVTKDFEEAVRYLEEALRMKRSLYDDHEEGIAKTLDLLDQATVHKQADALHELAKMHLVTNDFVGAAHCLGEAVRMKISHSLYDDQDAASIAKTLDHFEEAARYLGKALGIKRSVYDDMDQAAFLWELPWGAAAANAHANIPELLFDIVGEDEEGDDEAEDEEDQDGLDMDDWKAGTEAEDLGEEGADADDEEEEDEDGDDEEGADEGSGLREILVNESDEYQPGTTQEDVGQCDDDDSPRPLSRETPVVDEDMLLAATAPLLIDGPTKKKRKKKKKKKKRRLSKTVVVVDVPAEKKPPVPRFPHPTGPRPEKEAVTPPQVVQTLSEKTPLKERFSKQLLLGRFPKRKPARAEGTDSAVEADGETEPEKPDAGVETSAGEEPAPASVPPPRRVRVRRARSAAEPSAAKVRPRLAGPTTDDDATQSDADKAKTLSLAVVGSRPPKLRQRSRPVVTKSIWKEESDFDSGLGALYFSFSSMRSAEGQKVPLKNRDKVVRTLHELNSKVALPLCRHFGLRYNFFSEHHPQARKGWGLATMMFHKSNNSGLGFRV